MYHQSPLAPPLPPPAPPTNNNTISKGKGPAPDRNALLAQIRGGKSLKKAVTNDRSAPQVNNSKSSNVSGNVNNKISMNHDPMGLGSILAQGKPKLRPSFNRESPNIETTVAKQGNKQQLFNDLSKCISQSPSFNKQQFEKSSTSQLNSSNSYPVTCASNKINSPIKVAKPIPPPASSKPTFNISNMPEINQGSKTIGRSFNVKPLPPPKNLDHPALKFATLHQQMNKTERSNLVIPSPKLPVRNNSSPENLNELAKSIAPKINMLNSPTVKRSTSTCSRPSPQIKAPSYRPPPPPPAKATSASIPLVPPPVPKRPIPNIPNSNINITNNPPPPPPPLRTTSKTYLVGNEFENRFNNNFHKIQEFPLPHYQQTSCKMYISQVENADIAHQKNIKSKEMVRSIEC